MQRSSKERGPGGRPEDSPDYDLMVEASYLHYTCGVTRGAIAERFHVQTRKVTELLEEALRQKFVTITVQRDIKEELKLESQLLEKYPHLQRALIVKTGRGQLDDITKRLAEAAAEYFDKLYNAAVAAGKPFHVAVTGGETLYEFASNAVRAMDRPNLYVHTGALIGHGNLPEQHSHPHPALVCGGLWARSGMIGGRYQTATVSPYDSRAPGPEALKKVKEELLKVEKNTMVKDVVEAMNDIDVVFAGVGVLTPKEAGARVTSRYHMNVYLENIITLKTLYAAGVRGGFCYCPFDANGDRIEAGHGYDDDMKFFLTPGHGTRLWGVNFFKNMVNTGKKSVGFAIGPQFPALKIALEAGILNVIVTDTETALKLLGKKYAPPPGERQA